MNTQQRTNADSSNRSNPEKNASPASAGVAREVSDLWSEKMQAWNKVCGDISQAMMTPAVEAYVSLLGDCREVAKTTADQIHENMKILREGMQEFDPAASPADHLKTGADLQEKLTEQNAKAGQKMMALAADFASRRFRASAELAVSVIEKSRPRP